MRNASTTLLGIIFLLGIASCGSDDGNQSTVTAAVLILANNSSANNSSSSATCANSDYCRIFVTDSGTQGSRSGISGMDSFCSSDANKPSGDATWKALVVDGTSRIACTTANCSGGTSEHTDWVLKSSKEYRRTDGTTVIGTTTANGIFSFPLTNQVKLNEGITINWTGLLTNWSTGSDCANWTDATASEFGNEGKYGEVDSKLISDGSKECNNLRRIICVEQ
ncbi:MAG: DUF1554 domain-containing protein [Leptospiraceae bacterium]|nr:DUF1554 domain-containing protein [Leptospiraceae bacterium]